MGVGGGGEERGGGGEVSRGGKESDGTIVVKRCTWRSPGDPVQGMTMSASYRGERGIGVNEKSGTRKVIEV